MEKEKRHRTFPIWLSFLLNNPIRRRFDKNPERVARALGINETSVVLDFGCGPGFYSVSFAKIAKQVVAVDLQEKMLKKAEKYAQKNGVKNKMQFIRTDGEELPQLRRSLCDFVFLSFVYHEIGDASKERVLLELRRVLKVGGKLAIMEHTKRPLIGPHSVNPDLVKEELTRADFSWAEVTELSKNVGLIITIKGTDDHKDMLEEANPSPELHQPVQ